MSLRLEERYWASPAKRAAFKRYLVDIHGLDLTPWEEAGYWDEAYTPFSFFEGEEVVASVCLYLLEARVDGRAMRLAQISGVGTRPDLRRRGLNRALSERALAWAEGRHEGVFLFADDDACPFYERLGFTPIEEYVERLDVPRASLGEPAESRLAPRRLDVDDPAERARLFDAASRRAPLSDEFFVHGPRLLVFHALVPLRGRVLELPELEAFAFVERREQTLVIHDLVASALPSLEELWAQLATPGVERLELRFSADRLAPGLCERVPLRGNNPFVLAPFPSERPVFPTTCRA